MYVGSDIFDETNRSRRNDILNFAEGIDLLISEERYNRYNMDYNEDLGKDFPDETEKLEDASKIYISENGPKLLEKEFPDEWRFLGKKLAYLHNCLNSVNKHPKPVNNFFKKRHLQ